MLTTKPREIESDVDEIPGCIGSQIRMLNRLVSRHYDTALRHHDLTFAQFTTLSHVAERDGRIIANQIGTEWAVEKSTMSRNLRRIMALKLVEIGPPRGRSGKILTLTEAGWTKLHAAASDYAAAQKKALEVFGDYAPELPTLILKAEQL